MIYPSLLCKSESSYTDPFTSSSDAVGASYNRLTSRSMTSFVNAGSLPATSITLRFFSSKPSNSSGRTSRAKSNDDEEERACSTASLNLAGCAVARMIWIVSGELCVI